MSKSLGNSLFLKDLLDSYSPEVIKFALLQTNYRGDINVTDSLFPDAEKHLYDFYKILKSATDKFGALSGENATIDSEFNSAMDDDFNTALAISNLYAYFKDAKSKINSGDASVLACLNQIKKTYSLIGLFDTDASEFISAYESKASSDIPAEVKAIADERFSARQNKDWAKSDELRAKLSELGYEVKDAKDGYTLNKKQ
jgi:cysteinyl-tRNA synthetase